ncbi:MAG: serine protease [Gammaproteobacteria bacterium]|nr:serine protease [Gammaproteobacteria bacterium]
MNKFICLLFILPAMGGTLQCRAADESAKPALQNKFCTPGAASEPCRIIPSRASSRAGTVADRSQPASKTPRIVGGRKAVANAWPWMSAIVPRNRSASSENFCGGSLIHREWVLTAAHCMEGETPDTLDVVLGRSNLNSLEDGERIAVSEIIAHPNYDSASVDSDLALMRLAQPSAQPTLRILDRYSPLAELGQMLTVIGWGKDSEYGEYQQELQQVSVPVVSNELCNKPESYNGDITSNMLCAGYAEGGKDACIGDSGGPLMAAGEAEDGWYQAGIISFGEGCARPDYYGVYSRVQVFKDFIAGNICVDEESLATPDIEIAYQGDQLTVSWQAVPSAAGYQFYYAPYSNPVSEITLNNIKSFDMKEKTSLSTALTHADHYYVAVKAYAGVCDSAYSSVETIIIP